MITKETKLKDYINNLKTNGEITVTKEDEIQEMPDEEFSWKESYQFKEKDLPDGKYAFTYEVTDITGKSTMSDVAFLNLKNGEIKPEL